MPHYLDVNERRPVSVEYVLPHVHGERFYYHQLLVHVPFRDSTPSALISNENTSGTLRAELELRGIITADGGLAALCEADAKARHQTEEQIASLRQQVTDYEETIASGGASGAADAHVAAACADMDADDLRRLHQDIASAATSLDAGTPAPDVRTVRERADDGSIESVAESPLYHITFSFNCHRGETHRFAHPPVPWRQRRP